MQSFMQSYGEFHYMEAQEILCKLTPFEEIYWKAAEKLLSHAVECPASLIVNLEGLNELVPHLRDEMTRMLKDILENFLRQTQCDPGIDLVCT